MKNTNFKLTENNQYVNIETDEIISKDVLIKMLKTEQQEVFADNNEALIALGELPSSLVVNGREYEVVSVKRNHEFNKIFRVEVRNIMLRKDNKLSIHAKATIATLECFITFPSNCVLVDGKIPSREKLCDLVGVGKSKMYDILKELEYYEIIKRQKESGGVAIYFNPFLYCSGKVVQKTTYDLFKNSMYKPESNLNK